MPAADHADDAVDDRVEVVVKRMRRGLPRNNISISLRRILA
jgi:hypothetical protein